VLPVTEALNAALANENTQVVACHKGQIMGQDNDVRVFDVQHIKGLEFEAVFFIGIDRLAMLHPQLFDKFLYVGTTRAATYLGFTCDDALPSAISTLRSVFVSDWKAP
jgi:DNA helicase IV